MKKSKLRIEGMAMVHDTLYRNNDLDKIKFEKYIKNLTRLVNQTYGREIPVEVYAKDIYLPIGVMMKIGLIINELLTNSIKHAAYRKHTKIGLFIGMRKEKDHCILIYHQKGKTFIDIDILKKGSTLGMKLIRLTIIEMDISNNNGLKFVIRFSC